MANLDLTHAPSRLDRRTRALLRHVGPSAMSRPSAARKLARGLGWFSIALGLMELLAARQLARAIGMQGSEALLRAYGLREIASGCGILAARRPQAAAPWVWGRVAGDALDATTLVAAAAGPRPRADEGRPLVALAAVGSVAVLDVACARALSAEAQAARTSTDYSDRSGLGGSPEAMRGAALATFEQPPDMRSSPRVDGSMGGGRLSMAR
jgi:hypothetical protein